MTNGRLIEKCKCECTGNEEMKKPTANNNQNNTTTDGQKRTGGRVQNEKYDTSQKRLWKENNELGNE